MKELDFNQVALAAVTAEPYAGMFHNIHFLSPAEIQFEVDDKPFQIVFDTNTKHFNVRAIVKGKFMFVFQSQRLMECLDFILI